MLIQLESTSGFMKSTVATYFQMNKKEVTAATKLALILRYTNIYICIYAVMIRTSKDP